MKHETQKTFLQDSVSDKREVESFFAFLQKMESNLKTFSFRKKTEWKVTAFWVLIENRSINFAQSSLAEKDPWFETPKKV